MKKVMVLLQLTSQNVQLKVPLSPSKQPSRTGFEQYLYSGRSSSAGSALVTGSNCKVFHFERGIVTDIMPATSPEPGCGDRCSGGLRFGRGL